MTEQETKTMKTANEYPQVQPAGLQKRPSRTKLAIALVAATAFGVFAGTYGREYAHEMFGGHEEQAGAGTAEHKQLWTCGMHPQVIQDKPGNCPICGMALEPMKMDGASGGAAHASGGAAITIDPAVVQNMGVRVAKIGEGPIVRTIRAVGYLQQAQPRVHDVNLRVNGWVEKLHADTEGMLVKEGEPLFELYSPEIQVGIDELLIAMRSANSLPANADETSRRTAEVLVQSARRKLEQWGLQPGQIDQLAQLKQAPRTITFLSPMTAEVAEKMVVQGAMLKMGERAMQLVDRSVLWLDAQVYAQDFPFVHMGQKMTATVEGIPGREFEGEVIFIQPQVDPTTRTTTVRLAVPNPELVLRPGMFARASLTAQISDAALLVPREAILDTGTRQVVFVSMGDGHFEPRKVRTGNGSEEGTVQVLEGLEAGEIVVTSGQFLMDSESRMKEAIQKHLSGTLLAKAAVEAPTTETPKVERIEGSAQWNSAVDATLAAYLKISEQLGAVQQSDAPVNADELMKAAKALEQHAASEDQKELAAGISHGAQMLAGKPLDEQREGFKHLSDAAVALADVSPPSKKVSDRLYVLYCSMAPGRWLQSTDQRANPYYATEMKTCAVVQRSIEAAQR